MTERRRIAVVTTTRAEYGILSTLLREIAADPALELQLIVGGMHLSPAFGATVAQIEADGFRIAARVPFPVEDDAPLAIAKAQGPATAGFAEALAGLAPDLLVILGDRFEILAAAQAALVLRIPVAHIHGGEATEGAIDDAVRHALTKLSHLHFPAAEPYRRRIIQLGEDPARVFNFGAPGLDVLRQTPLLTRAQLSQSLGFALPDPFLLVTYHPVTLGTRGPADGFGALLAALDRFPKVGLLFTKPNADAGNRAIAALIDDYVARHPERAFAATSLGQQRYASAMALAAAVVGNSSSGIIEAPFLRCPTVNIGPRQAGRLRTASILDCEEHADEITATLTTALSAEFKAKAAAAPSLYGAGDASRRIRDVLKAHPLEGALIKRFHDLDR